MVNLLFIDNTRVLGGAERVILDIIKAALVKAGEVMVAGSSSSRKWAEEIRKNGGKTIKLETGQEAERWRGLNLLSPLMVWYFFRLRRFLKRIKIRYGKIPVLVQMHKEQILSGLGKDREMPLFWIQHPHPPVWLTLSPLRYLYVWIAQRRVRKIIAGSHSVKRALVKIGIKADKVVVIPNGLEIPANIEKDRQDSEFCRWYDISPRTKVVSTHGRIHPHKGQAYLLMAVKKIVSDVPDLKVIIAGEGNYRTYLEQLTLALGLTDQVILTGYYQPLGDILAITDVWISPSLNEGFSLSVLEAMSYARPVIATAVGGTREQISDGYDGRLVSPADVKTMAAVIRELLLDPQKAGELGRRAREKIITHYSLNRFVDDFFGVFNEKDCSY